MAHARTYLVINPGTLFHPRARIVVRSTAPAGTVVRRVVAGRPVRILLTDTPLPGHGDVLAAELQASL